MSSVTSRKRGLLGMWAAESIINTIDPDTAELTEERRTDIVYGWNDETQSIQFVFEFKKLNKKVKSWKEYLGRDGLGRFVTGIYSEGQPIAAMVGILLDPFEDIVPLIHQELCKEPTITNLCLCKRPNGTFIDRPSQLFPAADFDTEHKRPAHLASTTGPIRVAHLFLSLAL